MSKQLNPNDKRYVETVVHSTIELTSGSDGVDSVTFNKSTLEASPKISSSLYYGSVNQLFYKSHYIRKINEDTAASQSINTNLQGVGSIYPYSHPAHSSYPTYKNNWHDQGILYDISCDNYGEKIKPTTFQLTDTTNTDSIVIKDDGNGNLYASGSNYVTKNDASLSPSSSANYIGNIFYEHGIAVITDTGSYKSGNNYQDMGTNYSLSFDSTMTIRTMEIDCHMEANEFLTSRNYSLLKNPVTISNYNESYQGANVWGGVLPYSRSIARSDGILDDKFRRNDFTPYFTKIGFYNENKELVMVAHMSNPVKKLLDSPMTVTVQLDFV